MRKAYKIILINTAIAIISLFAFSLLPTDPWKFKDYAAMFLFITGFAAGVDLIAGIILLFLKRRETANGFLLSAILFLILAVICFLLIKPLSH